jgi:hypothetical protein
VLKRLAEQVGYEVRHSIEYNPEQMGSVERMIKEVKRVLYKWCENRIKKWAEFVCKGGSMTGW